VVQRLTSLFANHGQSDYIGEPLSITGHSVQAMLCAQSAGEDDEVQLAALLHDVRAQRHPNAVIPLHAGVSSTVGTRPCHAVILHALPTLHSYKLGHLLGLEAGFAPAMDGCGTENHEGIGAAFATELGLSDTVAYLTAQHVAAKR